MKKKYWFSSRSTAFVFSVCSYHLFNIRIFLLTASDSWYSSGAKKKKKELIGSCEDGAYQLWASPQGDLIGSDHKPVRSASFLFVLLLWTIKKKKTSLNLLLYPSVLSFGHEACGILAPWPGIKPTCQTHMSCIGKQINHWTARDVPLFFLAGQIHQRGILQPSL